MTKALYICYFGLREPLVQTQVLAYLREIKKDGVEITLLTFEPNLSTSWSTEQIIAKRAELAESGIDWQFLPYHKRPTIPATAYDILNGVRFVRSLAKRKKFDIFHARVHVPAMIAVLARKLLRKKPQILFDIRGFVPEEYADAGVWKKDSLLFRIAKRMERWIMDESNGFVVLTEAAREVLFSESLPDGFDKRDRPVEVIPCCVDFSKRFSADLEELRTNTRKELGLENRYVVVHVGSLIGMYLAAEIVDFLRSAREQDPSVFAMFLTQNDPAEISSLLRSAGFGENDFLVTKVDQKEVPRYLAASDLGLSFVRSGYATLSRSPTKIPEYLACGLPVIANRGVGDVDALIKSDRLGAVLDEFTDKAYTDAFRAVKKSIGVRQRAIDSSHKRFDLGSVGGERYRRLYRRLMRPATAHPRSLKTLYISYFSITEPLVQTQVLPYLREVASGHYPIDASSDISSRIRASLLTFERDRNIDFASIKRDLAAEGIEWHWLPYHKRFSLPATAWDIVRGSFFIRGFIARRRPEVLHGRVHVPTLMAAIARKWSRHKPKLLFDIRGFFPEEYTDAGIWPQGGWLYRAAKRAEMWLLSESDGFVVLTEKARGILFPESAENGFDERGRPVEVIPCCVDLSRFDVATDERRSVRGSLGIEDRFVITYVGSFGGWYLTEEMLSLFKTAKQTNPQAFFLILTQRNSEQIHRKVLTHGISESDFVVRSAAPTEVPKFIAASDAAVSFIKPCYSKLSSSPTKMAEYLACGLPVIVNSGIGDVDGLIESNRVGYIVDSFSDENYEKSIKAVLEMTTVAERSRETATREFDLKTIGGPRYRRMYERLLFSNGNGKEE